MKNRNVSTFTLTTCGGTKETSNAVEGSKLKYTLGTDATYPPFEFQKDGEYAGIDMDLIKDIAKVEGFEVEMKPMDFKGIIPAIKAKQLDSSRERVYDLTSIDDPSDHNKKEQQPACRSTFYHSCS